MNSSLTMSEMALAAEEVALKKIGFKPLKSFFLAILAGLYIAIAGNFAALVSAGSAGIIPFGINKLLMGLVFSVGLVFVVIGGAELFTGSTILSIPVAAKKVKISRLLSNWLIVYGGNFVGSLLFAVLVIASKQYTFGSGAFGTAMLSIASAKAGLAFMPAFFLGIGCNILVCLAIWMAFSARDVAGKILAIVLPITAFVALGFEHSVANMYAIPVGLFIKFFDPAFAELASSTSAIHIEALTWIHFFLNNLIPVTLGNIVGGLFIWMGYWFVNHK